ncbi:SRPBCC family protein [Terrabacter aerolatus]|uniref:Polyketide cyclase n=1 Tax=Terrabacter aerolatus TaxID=422442 RepID=A0A512CWK4_9MICO|nr:SRPBCC family protein [Terrabacter aerolatus]GEO28609.1 hypothetical protein TAE01_04190 [Terrabacter aerolatus]
MNPLTADRVTRLVDTDPATVYGIVADVTRTPEWSPEVVAVRWETPPGSVGGAGVGARFAATNRRRWMRWTNHPVVTAAEPGRVFSFSRTERGGGTLRWTYEMERAGGEQCRVSLAYEVVDRVPTALQVILKLLFGVDDLEADLHQHMELSLERLAVLAAEASTGHLPSTAHGGQND